MTPRWRHLQRRLAAACALCLCATSANGAGKFDYSVEPIKDVEAKGTTVIEAVDPELCGSDLGWIERLESEFEAEASGKPVIVFRRVGVRRAGKIEVSSHDVEEPPRLDSTVMVQYTGCVTPTRRMLVSFKAQVDIEAHDAPQRFIVTYEGPPMQIRSWSELKNLKVETNLGDMVVSEARLTWWPWLSADQHKGISISLKLKNQGDTR